MKPLFLTAVLIGACSFAGLTQTNIRYIHLFSLNEPTKIKIDNRISFKSDSLVITSDSARFYLQTDLPFKTFSLNDISRIRAKMGTYALTGTLIGGLTMGTIVTVKLIRSPIHLDKSEPENRFEEFIRGFAVVACVGYVISEFIIYTFAGIFAGTLIGSAFPKWHTYYDRPAMKTLSFSCHPYLNYKQAGLSFCLKF